MTFITDPGSYVKFVTRFCFAESLAAPKRKGSKSGNDAIASTAPVFASITRHQPDPG